MHTFSPETLEILHQARWSEDRYFDPSSYVLMLEQQGCPVYPAVIKFLQSFGRLQIYFPDPCDPEENWDVHFSIPHVLQIVLPGTIKECIMRAGQPLCPIGLSHGGSRFLFMDAVGRVYWVMIRVFLLGETGREAIETLCSGRKPPLLFSEHTQSNLQEPRAPLSQETLVRLHHAGWTKDRRVDTSEWVQAWQKEGLPVLPVLVDFLSRYGGLRIRYPSLLSKKDDNELIIYSFSSLFKQQENSLIIPLGCCTE